MLLSMELLSIHLKILVMYEKIRSCCLSYRKILFRLLKERTFQCQHTVTGDPIEMRLRLTARNSTDSPNFFHLVIFVLIN